MKYTRIATIALAIAAFGNSVQAQATLPVRKPGVGMHNAH